MENSYIKIHDYLQHLRDDYNIQICIKDFCGFIPINKELANELMPFVAHTNPYCMYMKSDNEHYHACLSMIRKIYNKCDREKKYFFGYCHAGVGEYVIPIYDENILLGSINVGYFRSSQGDSYLRLQSACECGMPLDKDKALALYKENIQDAKVDPQMILPGLEMLAEYLGHSYHTLQQIVEDKKEPGHYRQSNESLIVTTAINYIHENACKHITADELSGVCHCSKSYLSRVFKKHTDVNINVYINKVRVELSKNPLILSDESISEIAYGVGFNDSNYFSRIFTHIIGIAPTEFRRRFRKNV
jgi:AraC-like DNA-binding protein/ligand-binding sensor protein